MSILQRARESGKCPPSLLSDEYVQNDDGFDDLLVQMLDDTGFVLRPEPEVAAHFATMKEKVESIEKIPGALAPELKKKVLDYRRCVILAAIGSTPIDSPSLVRIVDDGYLTTVKSWLDSMLGSPEGNMDLLLHLLSSIRQLPVTKASVKESGMGKAIGDLGKHKICAGTPNETAIKDRIQTIKDAWQASVKARKPPASATSTESTKRPIDDSINGASLTKENQASKKQKTIPDTKKSSSFSNLLKKVNKESTSPTANSSKTSDSSPAASYANKSSQNKQNDNKVAAQMNNSNETKAKKTAKRVKWADHFGGQITASQEVDGEVGDGEGSTAKENSMSWSDRKKRDRLREKELLQKVKKAKLLDEDSLDFDIKAMQATVAWRVPVTLPIRSDVTLPQLSSPEYLVQNERIKSIPFIRYSSEHDVPSSPAPLSDVEQALDMTSQSSAVVSSIPFFVVQEPASIAPVVPANSFSDSFQLNQPNKMIQSNVYPDPNLPATLDVVQALGLPLFLVGQPVHALQALANSPGLLSTLVDANGMYDQARLMTLVQTLSSASGGQNAVSPTTYPQTTNVYDSVMASSYSKAPSYQSVSEQRYRVKSDEGNLHLIGYGPGTTEAEIIAAFSPYVKVDEVVMKGNFSFVNTSDPINAQRAKEALHGTLIGGMPIRINDATRKARDPKVPQYGNAAASASFPPPAPATNNIYGPSDNVPIASNPSSIVTAPSTIPQITADSYRDDKGNPATKNLFVAGYGPGTTELQLRQLFGQYAQVTGVVLKGTFSFVNTTDRNAAVVARQALSGFRVNGGQLRINFAKETGRLGTSFDLTYNTNTGPNALRTNAGPPPSSLSYYGRSGY